MQKFRVSRTFQIEEYSLKKYTGIVKFLESTICKVGVTIQEKEKKDCTSIILYYKCKVAECAMAQTSFTVVNQTGSGLSEISMKTGIMNFKTGPNWGYSSFTKSEYLQPHTKDDCLVIKIVITGFKDPTIVVPPVNVPHQLGLLLETGKGADVTFDVNGETFSAHKCILAARSPVFSTQFFAPMIKKSDTVIKIDEMEAPVFKALLHFIYNDLFPGPQEIKWNKEKQDNQLMAQHLLVAACRYNVERLRIICEKMLCDSIEKSNVITLCHLAEKHSCNHLRVACMKLLGSPGNFEAVAGTEQFPLEQTAPIVVPPVSMTRQLGLLLETGKGVDVTFDVNGETFIAHKCILAARSLVFSAQFFGPMKEKSDSIIRIEDMESPAFEALLHFIYNDSFPGYEEVSGCEERNDTQLMAHHLLVAADRYDLERLRIICEKILCNSIDKSNVGTLLSLSQRHSCNHLKAACVEFKWNSLMGFQQPSSLNF